MNISKTKVVGGSLLAPPISTQVSQGDYIALCEIWKELDEYHAQLCPDRVRNSNTPSLTPEKFNLLLNSENEILFIAKGNDQVLGFISLRIQHYPDKGLSIGRSFVLVDNIYVSKQCRSKGIGRMLIEQAKTWGKEKGVNRLELQVFGSNAEAIAFYESIGMSPLYLRYEQDF